MKITYPECQIEITAEELILLIDRLNLNNAGAQLVQEIERIKDDLTEQPAPKPYPNLTDQEAIIPRGTGLQNLIMQGLKEAEAQGKLPEELTQVEIPKEENTPVEIPKERKHDSTKKASNKKKKVEVKLDNGEWRTFNSISRAATYIGMSMTGLSNALIRGTKAFGHEVRYATDNNEPTQPSNEEQTELP